MPSNGTQQKAYNTCSDTVSGGSASAESVAPTIGQAVSDFFSTDEIFQRVVATADEEVKLPFKQMFFSGLAAGLSIGLSFYARAAISAQVPDQVLIANLFYPIGFILIVIGRYQLFTENTLTPVTLVLTRIGSIPMLLRVWGTVLVANLLGATLLAFVLANTSILAPEAADVARDIWAHAEATEWDALFFKGIMAGWLVASMVWLIHAARDTITRIFLVVFMMFLIPSADLYHCIIGFCEAMYALFIGEATFLQATGGFFLPVLLGNTVGGVLLVAILNYSMTRDSRFPDRDCGQIELTWREWLFEFHAGTSEEEHSGNGYSSYLQTVVSPEDHVKGPDDAGITLVQYGDVECPTSYEIYHLVRALEHDLGDDYRYIYRHVPISQRHPHAVIAGVAAEAAGQQGKFWEMLAVLFRNQLNLEHDDLLAYADKLNLDRAVFEDALESDDLRDRVESQRRDALDNGVTGTRNLFINGRRYAGTWTIDGLLEAIHKIQPEKTVATSALSSRRI